ncbi:hypothetical protein [Arabiibacter massiliensis]|uniref:hypothetical protein n=1 Tax=Arabiibacter massiliensis TaxID=1870985 RepID=UPI0009BA72D7|nr:hypothetical protein [Arabiibacter massiliensis]
MYYVLMLIFPIVVLGFGVFMVAAPATATKKDRRGEPGQVSKTRRNGMIVIILSIVLFAIALFQVSLAH